MPDGILIIDKPTDWTSMDVCAKLRGVFHEKRIGHGGTLDPMATGVLPVFIGRATRAVEFAEKADKEYIATLRPGIVTDTQDSTGRILEEHPGSISIHDLESVLPQFTGAISQIPPCIPLSKSMVKSSISWHEKVEKLSVRHDLSRFMNWKSWMDPQKAENIYCVSAAQRVLISALYATTSVKHWAAAL